MFSVIALSFTTQPGFFCKPHQGKGAMSRREAIVSAPMLASSAATLLANGIQVQEAFAEDAPILSSSNWTQVPLPVDPGVILLDLEFVPDEPGHGAYRFWVLKEVNLSDV